MAKSYPKWVENTVGKGEIARYEQFLFFPQCFLKACFPGTSKGVIVWEWVNIVLYLVLHSFLYLAIFECITASDRLNRIHGDQKLWYTQNYKILEKKTKNILENGQ